MATELLFMENMQAYECEAQIEEIIQQDNRNIIYLNQTVFYPQGGGQPYDTGFIDSNYARFNVEEVRFIDGKVLHIGHYSNGELKIGDNVKCTVDVKRRQLNTRIHSGGHLVDMAVHELGYKWIPTKGYHFPDGSYVEYRANLEDEPKDQIVNKINQQINNILSKDIKTSIRFMPKEKMKEFCHNVPDYLPEGKPSRIVLYDGFGVPCGGTHVASLSEIGAMTVKKIKNRPESTIRVSYELVND